MEQNAESQNGFWAFLDKYQIYVIVAILVAGAIVYSVATRDNRSENNNTNEQANEQQDENGEQNENGQPGPTPNPTPNPETASGSGNVSAIGILRASDDTARGNLVLESNRGKIYVATSRDFTSLIGKEVTLSASGDINRFTFLSFHEGQVSGIDTSAMGGAGEELPSGQVSFTGMLKQSDNLTKGNYLITSGATKVYLKSVHDYSAWVDSTVRLSATGTINSFTNAVLSK